MEQTNPPSSSLSSPTKTLTTNTNNTTTNSSSSSDDTNDTLLSLSFNQDGGCFAVGTEYGFRICNVSPYQETFRRTFVKKSSSGTNLNNAYDNGINGNKIENISSAVSSSNIDKGVEEGNNNNDDGGGTGGGGGDEESEITNGSGERGSINGGGGGGGIGGIEMLFRCNLLALVGGGSSPHYPPNKVLIWDDRLGRPIGELSFRQRVLTVRLRRDRICVALRDRVYVYNFGNLELLDTIMTGHNGLGLLCISTDAGGSGASLGVNSSSNGSGGKDDNGMVLACPSVVRGQVKVELYGHRKNVLIDAHESPLAAMALTVDGSLLATASEKGTLIRLFSTGWKSSNRRHSNDMEDGKASTLGVPLKEFRRGIEHAKIGSLSFSLDKYWLACASDRGTVHVFSVSKEEDETKDGTAKKLKATSKSPKREKKSMASPVSKLARGFLPSILTKSHILEGEHSYVQVRGIPHPRVCCFVPDQPHTVAVAGLDECGNGCLLLANFGGEDFGGDKDHPPRQMNTTNQTSSNGGSGIKSGVKGEARRVAYHRFFKKGTGRPTRREEQQQVNGDYGGTEEKPLVESCTGPESVPNEIEEITFADDDADGFVKTDYITAKSSAAAITTTPALTTTSSNHESNGHDSSDKHVEDIASLSIADDTEVINNGDESKTTNGETNTNDGESKTAPSDEERSAIRSSQ